MDQLRQEREHLREVLAIVRQKLGSGEGILRESQENIIEQRRFFWQNYVDMDIKEQLSEDVQEVAMTQRYSDRNRELRQLRYLLNTPYFARLDYRETEEGDCVEAEPETMYIGMYGLADYGQGRGLGDIYVYDWRSPVASMFYDFEYGPAWYDCPAGRIDCDISLRRQFTIEKGELLGMFDSAIAIRDEVLQKLLAQDSGERMKNIVTTIGREQNQVIRESQSQVLIISGCAGSGKTSVALHRVAYLMYSRGKNLKADNMMIFSPNSIFNDYISAVLPSMGEENIWQTTFTEFANSVFPTELNVQDYYTYMETVLGEGLSGQKQERIREKSGRLFAQAIESAMEELSRTGPAFRDIVHKNGRTVMSAGEMAETYQSGAGVIPVADRLAKLRTRFVQMVEQRIREERMGQIQAELVDQKGLSYFLSEEDLAAEARLQWYREYNQLCQQIDNLLRLDAVQLYRDLLERFFGPQARTDFNRAMGRGEIYYEDIAPLIYIRCLLGQVKSDNRIKHILVDEAQDYSYIQYRILHHLYRYAGFTILGDPLQTVNPHLPQQNFDYIAEAFGDVRRVSRMELNKSYRNSSEISRFVSRLVGTPNLDCVGRPGREPQKFTLTRAELTGLISRALEARQEEETVAILTASAQQARELYRLLEDCRELCLVDKNTSKLSSHAAVIPSYLAKGLEFDQVVVVLEGMEKDRHLQYVCCTRALHELTVVELSDPSANP